MQNHISAAAWEWWANVLPAELDRCHKIVKEVFSDPTHPRYEYAKEIMIYRATQRLKE